MLQVSYNDAVDAPSCLPSSKLYFKITLGDASGEEMVEVGNQQAMELFGDIRPNNFHQYQQLCFQLSDVIYGMTGGNNPFSAGGAVAAGTDVDQGHGVRPWLDCCVLAERHNESIHYCLFDTLLKQPEDTTANN